MARTRPHTDGHGRPLSTTEGGAAAYRRAQGAPTWAGAADALRGALVADPGFTVAAADLEAMTGTTVDRGPASPLHRWERHHVEVVDAAAAHQVTRAVDLLREHLASSGCDPIATAIVLDAAGGAGVDDLACAHPHCHVPAKP